MIHQLVSEVSNIFLQCKKNFYLAIMLLNKFTSLQWVRRHVNAMFSFRKPVQMSQICLFSFAGLQFFLQNCSGMIYISGRHAHDVSVICLYVSLEVRVICWHTGFACLQFTTLGKGEGKGSGTLFFPKTSKLQLQTQIKRLNGLQKHVRL